MGKELAKAFIAIIACLDGIGGRASWLRRAIEINLRHNETVELWYYESQREDSRDYVHTIEYSFLNILN